jgi:hypothetical protein
MNDFVFIYFYINSFALLFRTFSSLKNSIVLLSNEIPIKKILLKIDFNLFKIQYNGNQFQLN